MSWKDHAYFDIGVRIDIDENTTYHGNGWHKDNGEVHLCVGPKTKYVVGESGDTRVYYDGERSW